MGKTAIILGATGLTGNLLLQNLLEDEKYSKIKLFSRTTCGIHHEKIEEHLINLFDLEKVENLFTGDEVFCCIGTTQVKTPDKDMYFKIDFGIPVNASELCKLNNIDTFIVISALGADKNSSIFYNKTKGKMEEAVLEKNIKHTYILQPSLIAGDRNEKRSGEFIAKQIMKIANPFLLGSLKKYKSISPEEITNCMKWLANNEFKSGRIISDQIKHIVNKA